MRKRVYPKGYEKAEKPVEAPVDDEGLPLKRRGGYTKVDKPLSRKQILLNALRQSLSVERACEIAGISSATLQKWKDQDKAFADECQKSRSVCVQGLVERVYRIADHARCEAVQLNATMYLLRAIAPEYNHKQRIDHNIKEDDGTMPDYSYL